MDTCHSRGREKAAEDPLALGEHTYEIGSLEIAQRMFRVCRHWKRSEDCKRSLKDP